MDWVWFAALTISVNNLINIFLIKHFIIFCFSVKYLCISKISLVSTGLKSIEKSLQFFSILFPVFYIYVYIYIYIHIHICMYI